MRGELSSLLPLDGLEEVEVVVPEDEDVSQLLSQSGWPAQPLLLAAGSQAADSAQMAGALGHPPAAAQLATPEVRGHQQQQPNPMPATWPFGEQAWLGCEARRLRALDIRCGKRPAPDAPEQAATQAARAAPPRPPAAAPALPAALALPTQPAAAVPLLQAAEQGLPAAAVVPMEQDGLPSGTHLILAAWIIGCTPLRMGLAPPACRTPGGALSAAALHAQPRARTAYLNPSASEHVSIGSRWVSIGSRWGCLLLPALLSGPMACYQSILKQVVPCAMQG